MKQPIKRLFGNADRGQTRDHAKVACDPESSRVSDPLTGDEQDIGNILELRQGSEHRRKLPKAQIARDIRKRYTRHVKGRFEELH